MNKKKFIMVFLIVFVFESYIFYQLNLKVEHLGGIPYQNARGKYEIKWLCPITYRVYTDLIVCSFNPDTINSYDNTQLSIQTDIFQLILICIFAFFRRNKFWYTGKFKYVFRLDPSQKIEYQNYCTRGHIKLYKFIVPFKILSIIIPLYIIWQVTFENGGTISKLLIILYRYKDAVV